MTGSNGKLGLALLLALTATPAAFAAVHPISAGPATPGLDEVQDKFNQGVDLLRRGRDAEALAAFQAVLAMDPSHEQAYELWKSTDHEIWLDIIVKQGDFELVGKRLMDLARMGRTARSSDQAAIQEALGELRSDDVITRTSAIRRLAAEHGAYAVPYMIPTLGDRGAEDRRVMYMHALTQMDSDVVVPLIEALDSDDAFLRRNVALTLGYIGDARAAGMLAWVAANDPDGSTQAAAAEALGKVGGNASALSAFLKLGEDYYQRNANVLAPHMYSDVVWHWDGNGLASRPVPRDVYNDEMAQKCFLRALRADPTSLDARAGLARAVAVERAELDALAESGEDVADLLAAIEESSVAVNLAGPQALDRALQMSVASGDVIGGVALVRASADAAQAPTTGLQNALASKDAALRTEAALALAHIAARTSSTASAAVVQTLAESAGREIARIAFVIDADSGRAQTVQAGLARMGVSAHVFGRGAQALGMLHRVPGVDCVLVADTLPDLTTFQVIDDIRSDPRHESTPVLVLASDAAAAEELFGDKAQAVVGDAGDLSAVEAAMEGGLAGDRAKADQMAAASAEALAQLAVAGTNVSAALDALAGTLTRRPDAVTLPAMRVLRAAGTQAQAGALMAVLSDDARSEEARTAAGQALAAMFTRGAGGGDAAAIEAVMNSSAPLQVRRAAAQALGSQQLEPARRAQLLKSAAMKR